jgi:hypothetical protein
VGSVALVHPVRPTKRTHPRPVGAPVPLKRGRRGWRDGERRSDRREALEDLHRPRQPSIRRRCRGVVAAEPARAEQTARRAAKAASQGFPRRHAREHAASRTSVLARAG